MKLTLDQLPPKLRAQVEAQLTPTKPIPNEWPKGKEKEFQRAAERWLRSRGYMPRTKETMMNPQHSAGWCIHIPRALGNPMLLDILLLRHDGRWLEIELKTESGKLSECQQMLAQAGRVVRSMEELERVVKEWEGMR